MTRKTAYSEKLLDPRWQKKRLEIMKRDEFTCQCCYDSESQLQVHHLFYNYNSNPWDTDIDKLITLCKACHESFGEANVKIKNSISNIKDYAYISDASDIIDFMSQCNPDVGGNILLFLNAYYKMEPISKRAIISYFKSIVEYKEPGF